MGRARAKRQAVQVADDRLYSTWPETWLSADELASLGLEARWDLAGARRRIALQQFALTHRLPLYRVEQQFTLVFRGTRAEALARPRDRHPDHEELSALIRAQRRASLVDEA